MNKTTGLGRGLSSLIPTRRELVDAAAPTGSGIREISPNAIRENPRQPRKNFSPSELEDLIASIKEHGILQPLVVTEIGPDSFELIAGERRLRASRILGLEQVPVIIRTANDQQKLELALIENIQRQDLNAIEEAIAFQALLEEFHISQDDVAKRVGKSRSVVANTLRLLDLAEEMQQALVDGRISKSHARTLLAETDSAKREHLFHAMMNGGMTVREAEARAGKPASTKKGSLGKDPNIADHEKRLREILGTKVEVQDKGGRGKISIHYFSKEEFRGLLDRLSD